jgi:hypothetical protein
MMVSEASPMANWSGNQGRCAQEALSKDCESTVRGMASNMRDLSPCKMMIYIGIEFIVRDMVHREYACIYI